MIDPILACCWWGSKGGHGTTIYHGTISVLPLIGIERLIMPSFVGLADMAH